jgi:hypothetical protein
MPRSLIAIYAAAVCFAAAVCMSIAAGVVLFSVVRIAAPQLTSSPYQAQLQMPSPVASAVRVMPGGYALPPGVTMPPPPSLTPKQMEEMRQKSLRSALVFERSAGTRSLLLWGITLVVSAVLWLLHWRILRGARGAEPSGA